MLIPAILHSSLMTMVITPGSGTELAFGTRWVKHEQYYCEAPIKVERGAPHLHK
jgi:hypothetical protein